MDLDHLDRQILTCLQANACQSLAEIGARIGLSTAPCWNRIKRMEEAGIITGYTVRIDPAAIGFAETVIVQVVLESHTDEVLTAFGQALAQILEVLEAFLILGEYDYHIRIAVRDTRDYERRLRKRLYHIPGIRHLESGSAATFRVGQRAICNVSGGHLEQAGDELCRGPDVAAADVANAGGRLLTHRIQQLRPNPAKTRIAKAPKIILQHRIGSCPMFAVTESQFKP